MESGNSSHDSFSMCKIVNDDTFVDLVVTGVAAAVVAMVAFLTFCFFLSLRCIAAHTHET